MAKAICSQCGCTRPVRCRGVCGIHERRLRAAGALAPLPRLDPLTRFLALVEKTETCWNWTGSTAPNGYGKFSAVHGKTVIAHRWGYGQLVGPIPDGLTIDHLCRNILCVRPEHLEPVTFEENQRRMNVALEPTRGPAREVCKNGHSMSGDNLAVYVGKYRQYVCRMCQSARWQQRKAAAR